MKMTKTYYYTALNLLLATAAVAQTDDYYVQEFTDAGCRDAIAWTGVVGAGVLLSTPLGDLTAQAAAGMIGGKACGVIGGAAFGDAPETLPEPGLVGGELLPPCWVVAYPVQTLVSISTGSSLAGAIWKRLYCNYYAEIQQGNCMGCLINNMPTAEDQKMSGDIMDYYTLHDQFWDGAGDLWQGPTTKENCWNMCKGTENCVAMSYIEPYFWRFEPNTCFLKKGGKGDSPDDNLSTHKWPANGGGPGETRVITDRQATRGLKERIDVHCAFGSDVSKGEFCLPVIEWTVPEPDRYTDDGWFFVTSTMSKTGDDERAEVECPKGTSITGCACRNSDDHQSCDGAKMSNPAYTLAQKCNAYNGHGGHGVYAEAICAPGQPLGWWEVTDGNSASGAPYASAKCPSDKRMTGCSCHSWWKGCNGSQKLTLDDGTEECRAYSNGEPNFVTAQARCGPTYGGEWSTVTGDASNMQSIAECPSNSVVTGCSCRSIGNTFPTDSYCKSARTELGKSCVAESTGGGNVHAEAICAQNELATDVRRLSPDQQA